MQFLCNKDPEAKPDGFLTEQVGAWQFHYSPDLPIARHETTVLVGHAIDWAEPDKSNQDIAASLPENHARLAGRWAIFDLGDQPQVFGDGSMALTWSQGVAGSSAALLAHVDPSLKRKHRPEYDSHRLTGWHSGAAFVATDTEYDGVYALLTNHRLDLAAFEAKRFAPEPLDRRSLEDSVPHIVAILTGIWTGILARSPTALALTGGYDSRVLAAALSLAPDAKTRSIAFTIEDTHATPEGHTDIELATWIANTLDLEHHKLHADDNIPQAMRDTIRATEGMQAPRFEEWAALSQQEPLSGKLIVSGWASGIGRAYYSWPGSENIDAQDVLEISHLPDDLKPLFLEEAQSWLDGARQASRTSGVPVSDMLYWELRLSRWISANYNIMGHGGWWMTPYTCRDLLMAMIAIPETERGKRGHRLYVELIRQMRPKLLDRAINPETLGQKLKGFAGHKTKHLIATMLVKLGLYEKVRAWRRGR